MAKYYKPKTEQEIINDKVKNYRLNQKAKEIAFRPKSEQEIINDRIINHKINQKAKALILKEEKIQKINMLSKIVIGIIIAILIINFMHESMGNTDTITFEKFLQFLINLSNKQISLPNFINIYINGDWGILDGLRALINTIGTLISVLLYLANLMVNLINTITYVIRVIIFGM